MDALLDFGRLRGKCDEVLKMSSQSAALTEHRESYLEELTDALIEYTRINSGEDLNEVLQSFFGRLFGPEPEPQQAGLRRRIMRRFKEKTKAKLDGRQTSLDDYS